MTNDVNGLNANYQAALRGCDTLEAVRMRERATREAGILRVGRAIIALEQDEWATPAEEWTLETFRCQGIWAIAEAAYDAALAGEGA